MFNNRILEEYSKAVAALKSCFGQSGAALYQGETIDQYEYSVGIDDITWIKENLDVFVLPLLQSHFQICFLAGIYDLRIKIQLYSELDKLYSTVANIEEMQTLDLNVPETAVEEIEKFRLKYKEGDSAIQIADFIHSLDSLETVGASITLTLQVFFDKNQIYHHLKNDLNENLRIVIFLFPDVFLSILEKSSLDSYERDFYTHHGKTICLISGYSGFHIGKTLAIWGLDRTGKIDEISGEPVSEKTVQFQEKVIAFRKSQGTGVNPSTWLIPESFDFDLDIAGQEEITIQVRRQFNLYKGLLSALFLADSIDKLNDKYRVEYEGYGRTRIELNRTMLEEQKSDLEDLYLLYRYAYDGLSLDKLEIAQQFLSLIAINLGALCSKANDIKDATKKTFDRYLSSKVEDYFQARHLIQERLKTVAEETSASVISLSRDVSDDLYKVVGLIAAAIVGSFLEPNLTLWAAIGSAIAIFLYVGLVVVYHLRTVNDSYALKLDQHKSYIQSYKDILREEEMTEFVGFDNLKKAETLFTQKIKWARIIYIILLVIAMTVIFIAGMSLFHNGGISTLKPTPTP